MCEGSEAGALVCPGVPGPSHACAWRVGGVLVDDVAIGSLGVGEVV